MSLQNFLASTIGRSVDLYLDRLWLDSLAALVGEFFPLTNVRWWYVLLYTCMLTILGVIFKKFLGWVGSVTNIFDFSKRDQQKESEELLIALGQNK